MVDGPGRIRRARKISVRVFIAKFRANLVDTLCRSPQSSFQKLAGLECSIRHNTELLGRIALVRAPRDCGVRPRQRGKTSQAADDHSAAIFRINNGHGRT